MSGVEFIVGTVLASVPLALELYDRSERAFQIFSVFKHYPRELRSLKTTLGAQRTIFRNNAIILLTAITKDRAKVQGVVNQPSSQAARQALAMSSMYQCQTDGLAESFVSCRQTAEQINDTLQRVCAQAEDFYGHLGQKQANTTASDWLKHVRSRFKLSLNKPHMEKAITELRDFNKDFELITQQTTRMLEGILNDQKEEFHLHRKSARYLNTLQRYHRVRFASKALYSTLQVRWMCPSHPCHVFDLRIIDNDAHIGKGKGPLNQNITCELAITHDDASLAAYGPLRLEIEQACEDEDDDMGVEEDGHHGGNMEQLTTVLETSADTFTLTRPAKSVRIDRYAKAGMKGTTEVPDLTQPFAGLHLDEPASTVAVAASPARDLGQLEDFCKTFHEVTMDSLGRSLLGILKDPHAQWFYLSPPKTPLGTSQSLSDMIAWIAKEPLLRSLPRPRLVELAGDLAEGIMQFYSTPWLTQASLGQNVRIFHPSDPSLDSIQLNGPYFMARLETRAKGKMKATSVLDESVSEGGSRADSAGARNKLLFNFGILLLEIGFGQPWHELKQAVSKSTTTGQPLTDYRTAEKLAQLLVNRMGLTYPKIIKKCLGCDFGLGETDLDNEDLQRRFLEDVVLGLQQLREHMREMNLYPLG